jgi:hypothetical protein
MKEYIFMFSIDIYVYISAPKLDHHVLGEKDAYVKFASASSPCTHVVLHDIVSQSNRPSKINGKLR